MGRERETEKLRAMLEINLKSKYMMKINTISDGLAELETAKMRTRHVLNPIIDWTSDDIWAYIRHFALPYCRNYDEGFTRMGCIGCPMSGHKENAFKDERRFYEHCPDTGTYLDQCAADAPTMTIRTAEDLLDDIDSEEYIGFS